MNLQELIAKRAEVWETAKAFVDSHQKENGTLSVDDTATYEKMEAEITDLTTAIDRARRAEEREAELSKPVNSPLTSKPQMKPSGDTKTGRASDEYKRAFTEMLHGVRNEHEVLMEGEDADGGYLVPIEFERNIIMGMDEANVVRPLARVITTQSERKIPLAATHSVAQWTAENGAYQVSNPTFDQTSIDAHKLTDLAKVSIELLQDSMFDIPSYLSAEFSRAFGIAEEEAFCVGSGEGQPLGIFTHVYDGTTHKDAFELGKETAKANEITADELLDLVYSLKSPYRRNARFLLHEKTVASIRKLKDGNGVYMWQPALTAGEPDRLLGYPVVCSPYVPQLGTAGNLVCAFGDFKNYWIADRMGITVQRLNELYATNGQIGFICTKRLDAKPILSEGVKLLQAKTA